MPLTKKQEEAFISFILDVDKKQDKWLFIVCVAWFIIGLYVYLYLPNKIKSFDDLIINSYHMFFNVGLLGFLHHQKSMVDKLAFMIMDGTADINHIIKNVK